MTTDFAVSVTGKLEVRIYECRESILRLEREADQASNAVEHDTKALRDIERMIEDARLEFQAFEEALRLVQIEARKSGSDSEPGRNIPLRPGTKVAKVRDLIREAGKPLYIDEVIDKLGEPRGHNARMSLVGSLSKYVKGGRIFTRTAPNTFGLKGMDSSEEVNTAFTAITTETRSECLLWDDKHGRYRYIKLAP